MLYDYPDCEFKHFSFKFSFKTIDTKSISKASENQATFSCNDRKKLLCVLRTKLNLVTVFKKLFVHVLGILKIK